MKHNHADRLIDWVTANTLRTNYVVRLRRLYERVSSQFTVHLLRAFLLASQAVPSFLAGLRAIVTFPSPGADATAGRRVA